MSQNDSVSAVIEDGLAILDALDAFIYSKDRAGNYLYANKAVQDLFGASLDQIRGHDDTQFFDLERSSELRDNDHAVMDRNETIERKEHNLIKETGEARMYLTIKSPLRNTAGEVTGMCGISLDITDHD